MPNSCAITVCSNGSKCCAIFQTKKSYVIQDPGYEYPPEPELRFHYYKFGKDVDDDEDDDDDDDNDETLDNNNNNNYNNSSNNDTNRNNTNSSFDDKKNNSRNATSEFDRNGATGKSKNGCAAAADQTIKMSMSTAKTTSNTS